MSKSLIIAEKPSVAADIARVLGGFTRHDDYFEELGDKAKSGALLGDELAHLREELDAMAARGNLPLNLRRLREDLDALHAEPGGARPPDASRG